MRSAQDLDLDGLTDLAVAAQCGDRVALEALARELQSPIYRLAVRFSGPPADAEDATFEVLLRLLTTLQSYDGRVRFTIWVYAGAVRQLLRTATRPGERAAGAEVAGTDGGLLSLAREQRVAYILCDRLGFTVAEVAEMCELDPSGVEAYLLAARAALRDIRPGDPGAMAERDLAVDEAEAPSSIWTRLVATMPSRLGAD